MRKLCLTIGVLFWLAAQANLASPVVAQNADLNSLQSVLSGGGGDEELIAVSASFTADQKSRAGKLSITAEIAADWHVYSITQRKGGPVRSQIKLDPSKKYTLKGDFKPSTPPKSLVDEKAYPGLPLEEHEGAVTWTAPIELAAGVDAGQLKISGKLFAQTCSGQQCSIPKDFSFTASYAAAKKPAPKEAAPKEAATSQSADAGNVGVHKAGDITFRGYVTPRVIVPGGKFKLVIAAEPAAGWHIYEMSDKAPASAVGARPTLLALTDDSGLKNGPAVPSVPAAADQVSSVRIHEEPVTWTVELKAAPAAKRGPLTIEGLLGYQICTAKSCQNPSALGFSAQVTLGAQTVDGQVPLKFDAKHKYTEVQKLVTQPAAARGTVGKTSSLDVNQFKPAALDGGSVSLPRMMGFGFLGGLILNVMPCVLPVIGLKILSFFEQSGHSRGRAFVLNLWYALGMLSVFMVLATVPVVLRTWFGLDFGWGQQFSYVGFNVTLAALVFAMALSFLGIWEIPIPGFVGGSTANQLASKEGFTGAFAKGAITTVLATPCSGPYLGTALGFALAQPPAVIYLMFASIGLGMASPYLLIGAFPQLLRWLPKPGAWMDTFKQVMGFVLLGTVVYLMRLVRPDYFIPTLALLFGIWAGVWWIGRTPVYAELPAKLRSWGVGIAVAGIIGALGFQWLGPQTADSLAWRKFSIDELTQLTAEGKTVMLDFTADWCPNCKYLEHVVLNTPKTKDFIERRGIVAMVADLTEYPAEEQALLNSLGAKTIPFMAIFPAGRPNEPIVLPDVYTQGTLFEKLEQAGASSTSRVASLSAR